MLFPKNKQNQKYRPYKEACASSKKATTQHILGPYHFFSHVCKLRIKFHSKLFNVYSYIVLMKITRAKILIATSIVPQILLMKIISLYPEKVELYFSQIFYPKLFSLQQFFVDPIPFSIGDLIYLLLGVYVFYLIVRFLMKLKLPSIKILVEIGAFISVLFLII